MLTSVSFLLRCLLWLVAGVLPLHAASFDCARASSKLTRAICADPELSRLDEQVWDAYGERIKTLTPNQYEQVRDRHITWRRQRGRFERGIDPMIAEYRRHLAWLTHPLLPYEGRYQRADGALLAVEIDPLSPAAAPTATVHGLAGRLQWMPTAPGAQPGQLLAAAGAGAPLPAVPWREGQFEIFPSFAGTPIAPITACRFTLRWQGEIAQLASTGACGADFDGDYLLQKPANPWPRIPPRANAQGGEKNAAPTPAAKPAP